MRATACLSLRLCAVAALALLLQYVLLQVMWLATVERASFHRDAQTLADARDTQLFTQNASTAHEAYGCRQCQALRDSDIYTCRDCNATHTASRATPHERKLATFKRVALYLDSDVPGLLQLACQYTECHAALAACMGAVFESDLVVASGHPVLLTAILLSLLLFSSICALVAAALRAWRRGQLHSQNMAAIARLCDTVCVEQAAAQDDTQADSALRRRHPHEQ